MICSSFYFASVNLKFALLYIYLDTVLRQHLFLIHLTICVSYQFHSIDDSSSDKKYTIYCSTSIFSIVLVFCLFYLGLMSSTFYKSWNGREMCTTTEENSKHLMSKLSYVKWRKNVLLKINRQFEENASRELNECHSMCAVK